MRDGLWVGIIEKSNIEKFLKHFFKNIWIVGWDQLITIFKISRTSRALIVFSNSSSLFMSISILI
jgi:hypothetical protein